MNQQVSEIVEEYDVSEATAQLLIDLCGDDLDFLRVSLEDAEDMGL